jgi:hypothetical protein
MFKKILELFKDLLIQILLFVVRKIEKDKINNTEELNIKEPNNELSSWLITTIYDVVPIKYDNDVVMWMMCVKVIDLGTGEAWWVPYMRVIDFVAESLYKNE